jgi:hypothetical protein
MKILFVDHAFHQRTRSAEFFVEEVRKHGEVDIFYFDPDEHERHLKALNAKLQRESWDLVIVWQLEILALASIRLGLPTIICPMYDGSSTQPPEHWKVLWQSAAIQFSLQLSIATQRYQRRQMLVRYYPDPKSATPVEDFSRLNAFLWVRRSSEVVAEHAFLLLRGQVDTFHFHIALDDPNDSYILPDWLNAYPVTTSTWFESKVELQNVLDRCNVYICPRHTEGIGMAMLEAMNRGMAVLASSLPVHN